MIEAVALVVGGEAVIVERERRFSADDAAVALEELEPDRAGDALLHVLHERVDRLARRRKPEAVVDDVGVFLREALLESLEILGDDQPLELAMRGMQNDGRRRLVDFARLDADQPILDHVDSADAVNAGNRLEAVDELGQRHGDAVDRRPARPLPFDLDIGAGLSGACDGDFVSV